MNPQAKIPLNSSGPSCVRCSLYTDTSLQRQGCANASMVSKTFLLIEQVCPTTTEIDDLRAAVSILLQSGALEAIKGITDSFSSANYTFVLIISKRAFVAYADERCWAHVAIAHRTLPIALVAQTADRYAGLFAAHDQVTNG